MKFLIVLALAHASLAIPMGVSEVPSTSASQLLAQSLFGQHAGYAAPVVGGQHFNFKNLVSPLAYTPSGFLADAPETSAANVAQYAGHTNFGFNPWAKLYNPYLSSFAVNHGGYLADNPDAVVANAAHLAEQAKAVNLAASIYPGLFASSPEVASANDNHFAEYVKAFGFPAAFSSVGIVPNTQHVALGKAANVGEQTHLGYNPWAKFLNHFVAPHAVNHLADSPDAVVGGAAHSAEPTIASQLATASFPGLVPNSPIVALAKANQFAELAKALGFVGGFSAGAVPNSQQIALANAANFAGQTKMGVNPWLAKFVYPFVAPHSVSHNSYLADNPDAVIANAAHIAQQANAAKFAAAMYPGINAYSAMVPFSKSAGIAGHHEASGLVEPISAAGVIPESPAVALAKAAHFAEHAKSSAIANAIVDNYPVASSFPVQW